MSDKVFYMQFCTNFNVDNDISLVLVPYKCVNYYAVNVFTGITNKFLDSYL